MRKVNTSKKIKKENFFSRGWTDKAFLMTLSALIFFLFLSTGLTMLLLQEELNPMYLTLLGMAKDPLMIIIGSVFALEATQVVVDRKTKQEIESIVETQVSNVDLGREVSENVYDSIELENFDMNTVEKEYQKVYQDEANTNKVDEEENSGEYLV